MKYFSRVKCVESSFARMAVNFRVVLPFFFSIQRQPIYYEFESAKASAMEEKQTSARITLICKQCWIYVVS